MFHKLTFDQMKLSSLIMPLLGHMLSYGPLIIAHILPFTDRSVPTRKVKYAANGP
jgi:hypothetical protein